jgi:betaine reductase
VDRTGQEDLVVLLGTPTPESSKLYAMTVTEGDPTWAGALAGEALGLPVYHIIEPEIRAQIDSEVYEAEVGVTEMVLDAEEISAAVSGVRANSAGN